MSKLIDKYHSKAKRDFRNYEGEVRRQSKAPAQQLDHFVRTLTIKVALITGTAVGKATIFGASWDTSEATNTANNTTVTIEESSHTQVKTNLLQSPMRIGNWKIIASSESQLAQPLSIISRSAFGASSQKTLQPMNYISPEDVRSNMVQIKDAPLVIDAETGIEVNLDIGASATIIVQIVQKVDISATMNNAPVVKSVN